MKKPQRKVNTAIILGFVLLIIIIVMVGGFPVYESRQAANFAEMLYMHPLTVSNAIKDIQANINAMHRSMKDVALAKTSEQLDESVDKVDAYEEEVFKSFDIIEDRFLGDKGYVISARKDFENWKAIRSRVIQLMRRGKQEEAAAMTKEEGIEHIVLMNEGKDRKSGLNYLLDFANNKASEFQNLAKQKGQRAALEMFAILFLSIALALIVVIVLLRSMKITSALETSEVKFRAIFEQAAVGVAQIETKTGRFSMINQKYCDMVGYTKEEMTKTTFIVITHPNDLQADLDNMQKLIEGQIGNFSMEKRYVCKDGSIIWVNLTVSPMWNIGEEANFHIAVAEDISDSKKAEEALRRAHEELGKRVEERTAELAVANEQLKREIEEHQQTGDRVRTERDRFETILEANPNGIYIVDQQYNIEYINPVIKNEFGPIDGQKCYAYFHDRTESCPWCKNDEVLAGKSVYWQWYSKKNNRYYDLFDTPMKNSDGSISKFEIFYDITERKQTEERLKESEQKLSGILHSISDHMSMRDKDHTITWANEVTKKSFGPDIIGKKCFSCFHGRKQPCDSCQVIKTFQDGQDHHHETQLVDRYGNNRIFHCVSSVADYDENGKPKLVIEVSRDITQIKQSENELHQLRAELLHATRAGTMVELTGALAHELNHPLGSILNNANAAKRFLKSNNPDLDEIRDIIADIISEDRRASEIIQKLRALMRKTAVKFVPLEINDIMEEVVSLTKSEIVIKKVSLSKQLATKLPKINGERIQLQQIFLNLVINAIDAIKGCKVKNIHISTAKHDAESIIICVRDTGVGFDEKNKGSLFKPFFTTKKEGLGMGLSVNKTIVNSHGGDIWVENNKEGGARFFITLPVYKEQSS